MEKTVVDQLVDRIFTLLGERLGVRGKTLEARFRKAGRLVPKRARAPIKVLIEAEKMAQNPTIAIRIDPEALAAAYDKAVLELGDVDRDAEKSRKRFNMAALLGVQILLIAVVFVAVMRWRGFL